MELGGDPVWTNWFVVLLLFYKKRMKLTVKVRVGFGRTTSVFVSGEDVGEAGRKEGGAESPE